MIKYYAQNIAGLGIFGRTEHGRSMKIAIVTGASSGMGRELVRQLDVKYRYDEIWVIARRAQHLEALQGELTQNHLRILPMDLTEECRIREYEALLQQEQPEVQLLANVSGFGKFGRYDQIPLQDCMDMIDLNVKALVAVTQITLPYLVQSGQILQWDSLSAFQPVPYLNVYGATKAFVLSYSRALNAELAPRGIRVTAVCPGWVKTEFFERAEQVSDTAVTYFNCWYTAEFVVREALKKMGKRDVVVPGVPVRMQVLLTKFLPHRLVMWIWLKQQKH